MQIQLPIETSAMPAIAAGCVGALGLSSAVLIVWHLTTARSSMAFWRRAAVSLRGLPAARTNVWPLLLVLFWTQVPALLAAANPSSTAAESLPSTWQLLALPLLMNGLFATAVVTSLRMSGLDWRQLIAPCQAGVCRRAALAGLRGGILMLTPVWLLSYISIALMDSAGWPVDPQEALELLFDGRMHGALRLWLILVATLAAPVFEEALFRGTLLPALARGGSSWRAVLLSSLLFAAIHLHAGAFLPLFGVGVACALGYMATGHLLTPVIMHALFNAASLTGHLAFPG
ncbi:MAG: type II CAAX endopeptidase family protein [Kiritimatiellae bacterium]|nr:type II CAAX endopeptidase family protein [Kiritimatiellia bacterium]